MFFFLFCSVATYLVCVLAVVAIDEAAQAVEVLLGLYTGEEHARRRVVVRDARLNQAYDSSVRLAECPDLDEGEKKRTCMTEVEVRGPIAVMPLRTAGPCGVGGSSCGREDTMGPAVKRAAREPSEQVERAESNNLSSAICVASPKGWAVQAVDPGALARTGEFGAPARMGGCAATEAASVGGLFGLAKLPLDISSCSGTPSSVYERGAEDSPNIFFR